MKNVGYHSLNTKKSADSRVGQAPKQLLRLRRNDDRFETLFRRLEVVARPCTQISQVVHIQVVWRRRYHLSYPSPFLSSPCRARAAIRAQGNLRRAGPVFSSFEAGPLSASPYEKPGKGRSGFSTG